MMTEVRAPEHGNHMESLNYSFAFVVQAAEVGSHKYAGLRLDHGVWLSMVWLANVLHYLQHLYRVLEFVQCVAFSFEVSFILELVMTRPNIRHARLDTLLGRTSICLNRQLSRI